MQLIIHIQKYLARLVGLAVICCVIGAFFFNCYSVQSFRSTAFFATTKMTAYVSASFKTASTIHKLLTESKGHFHFSLKNRTAVKLLMKKGSSDILSVFQLQLAEGIVCNILTCYSIIALPGYYLFLFRYALF